MPSRGRGLTAHQIVERLVGEHGDLRIEQGNVDRLAFAAPLPMRQRCEHADDGVETGEQIGEGNAALDRTGPRFAVWKPGDAHDAAHALDHEIVAGALRIGTVLAKAGDGTVDEPED